MKTNIKKSGDTIVVEFNGKLNFEIREPLKNDLSKIIDENRTDSTPKKIIFNLEKLDFVGSSGISNFIQTLREFNHSLEVKPKYCHVKSEFQKIIKSFDDEQEFNFYDSEETAKRSFDN